MPSYISILYLFMFLFALHIVVFLCLLQNKSAAAYIEASKARISQYEKEVNKTIVLNQSEGTVCSFLTLITGQAMWQC